LVAGESAPGHSGMEGSKKKNKKKKEHVEDAFELGKVLGEGNYAQVRLGKEKSTGGMWAVKVINKKKLDPGDEEMLALEVEVLRTVNHPNVIHLYKVYDTSLKMYMVLELVTGGELLDRLMNLGKYSEQDACDLFAKVMHAVAHLHEKGIAHRDLKPENLLLANPGDPASIKIADFGFAKIASQLPTSANGQKLMMTSCGTPEYVAPEVLANTGYGVKCDVWSMGEWRRPTPHTRALHRVRWW
jgi:calcium/calmodulin-dependent protein kinase I